LKRLIQIGFDMFSFFQKSNFDFYQSYSTLFVIQDIPVSESISLQSVSNNTNQGALASKEMSELVARCFPDLVVNEIKCVNPVSVMDFFENPTAACLVVPRFSGDLKKIQNVSAFVNGEFNLVVSENWNFEAVRKLPWKFHCQGVRPYFFDVNRNQHWQNEKKVYKRLYAKGVMLPVDILSIVRWQEQSAIWWKKWLQKGSRDAKQAKAALYVSEIQIDPPVYLYLSELYKLFPTSISTKLI
jgi:hypothetical protein